MAVSEDHGSGPHYLGTSHWQSLVNADELFNIHMPQLSLTPPLPSSQLPHPVCLQALSTLLPFQLSDAPPLHLPVPKFIHIGPYLLPASPRSLLQAATRVQKYLMMSLPEIKAFKFNSVFLACSGPI